MRFHPSEMDWIMKNHEKSAGCFFLGSLNCISYKNLIFFCKQHFKSQIQLVMFFGVSSANLPYHDVICGSDGWKIKCLWIWVLIRHDSRMQVEDFKGGTTQVLLIFLRQWLSKLLNFISGTTCTDDESLIIKPGTCIKEIVRPKMKICKNVLTLRPPKM